MALEKKVSCVRKNILKGADDEVSPPMVIAICSSETCYRLSWLINKEFSINLQALIVDDFPSVASKIIVYRSADPMGVILLPNRFSIGEYFIPSLKSFDYLLLLPSSIARAETLDLSTRLRKIDGITIIHQIQTQQNKLDEFIKLF